MFIKLTHSYTGKPIMVNLNSIQGITPSEKGGTDIWLSDSSGSLTVKEEYSYLEKAIIEMASLYKTD